VDEHGIGCGHGVGMGFDLAGMTGREVRSGNGG
jgi:hypothetical protein